MTNYQAEIQRILEGMSEEQIVRLAKQVGSLSDLALSVSHYKCELRFAAFTCKWTAIIFFADEADLTISGLEDHVDGLAAFAIFLGLVKRDLPDVEIPYVEGVDCG